MKPISTILLAFFVLLAPATGAWGQPAGSAAAKKPLTKVVLAISARPLSASFANFWVGKELGFHAEEGIDLEVIAVAGGAEGVQYVATRQAHASFGMIDPMLLSAAKGQDLGVVVYYNATRAMVMQLAVKPGSGIQSISQLKGKKIGPASLASTGLTYAKSVLKDAGIDPEKDIQVLPVGSGVAAADALYRGRVDALALWDSAYAVMENAGFKLQLLPHPPETKEIGGAGGLIVRREFVKNNPDLAVGLARASAKGTIFMLENPEALVRLHWKMFPETKPTGVDDAKALQDEIRVVNARADKMDPSKSGMVPRWGAGAPEEYVAYAKWLGAPLPDLSKYYDMSLIDRINDFDAEKVRQMARSYKVR